MDIVAWMGAIRGMAIFAGIVGLLAGLDLLFGGKLIIALRNTLEKPINLDEVVLRAVANLRAKLDKTFEADKTIIKTTTALREALDKKTVDIDTPIMNTQLRLGLGALFLILAASILLLIRMH